MPNIVCIDLEVHKSNLPDAIDRAIKSQSQKIVFIGLNLALVTQAYEAGREVVVLPLGSPTPANAIEVPFFPGTDRSRAFVQAQEMLALRSTNR